MRYILYARHLFQVLRGSVLQQSGFKRMSARDKVALVTGAGQGLGKAFSEILLQNGAKVGLIDINSAHGAKTLKEFARSYGDNKVMFLKCDVTNAQEMKSTFKAVKERFGGLDIVVNNAGVGFEMDDMWEKTVDVNVKGTMRGTMLAIDSMRRDKGGKGGVIVIVSSMAGKVLEYGFCGWLCVW